MHMRAMICTMGGVHRHRVTKKKRSGHSHRQKVMNKVRLTPTSTSSHIAFDTEINEFGLKKSWATQ